jgi:hypothetical protein
MANNVIQQVIPLFNQYNRVTFPREGINPLDVYVEMQDKDMNKDYNIIGSLSELVEGKAIEPKANVNLEASGYIDKSARGMDASIGVSLLDEIIKTFGLGDLSLKGTYKNAYKFDMSFTNSLIDLVNLTKVYSYLKSSQPNATYQGLVGGKTAYVIHEIVKSKTIGIVEYDEKGRAIDAKSKIKAVLDLGIQAHISETNDKEILYEGKKYLTFGFRPIAVWIISLGGKLTFMTDIFTKVSNAQTLAAGVPTWSGIETYANEKNFNILFDNGDFLIPQYDSPGVWVDLREKVQ